MANLTKDTATIPNVVTFFNMRILGDILHHSVHILFNMLQYQFSDGPPLYRVSQEERTKLRESVPYVKLYRYNPKHLYPKLNGYGDNGKRSLKL